ncbi:MAG: hemolysin family protein [Planctomycetes bacterium]|nr:hemolysin family protein [Planctomycetota bacterium]
MAGLEWIIVVLMVLVNALFAAYEIALASVTKARLQTLKDQGRFGAQAAIAMKESIEKSLAVVQLGITVVGLIAGATSGATASESLSPVLQEFGFSEHFSDVVAIAVFVAPLTIATIVIGELVPKLFALRNKEWVCLTLSPWMRGFALLAWPLVWLLESSATGVMDFSERLWSPKASHESKNEAIELQELRAIASLARTSSLIGSREENIILGAARLASRSLSEIALPASQIHVLPLNSTLSECLIAAHMDMHTRFPVAKDKSDPQTIVGYVTFKDIVSVMRINPSEPSIAGILRSIPKLDQSLQISVALERLLREHTHIALVTDTDGKISGMITLEDIVEELLGDIQDEYDMLPIHAVRAGQGWLVGGGISLIRLKEITGLELEGSEMFPNLNAWVSARLGHLPIGGDTIEHQGIRVLVRKVRRQRVLEALVSR